MDQDACGIGYGNAKIQLHDLGALQEFEDHPRQLIQHINFTLEEYLTLGMGMRKIQLNAKRLSLSESQDGVVENWAESTAEQNRIRRLSPRTTKRIYCKVLLLSAVALF